MDSFLAAVIGGVIGAALTHLFTRRREKKRELEKASWKVYLALVDLFWGSHSEIKFADDLNKSARDEARVEFQARRGRILDEMRKIDNLPELKDICEALFSLEFHSENERGDKLQAIIRSLGNRLNPNFEKIMAEISIKNLSIVNTSEGSKRRSKIEYP